MKSTQKRLTASMSLYFEKSRKGLTEAEDKLGWHMSYQGVEASKVRLRVRDRLVI